MLPAYALLALPLAVVGLPLTIYVPALYAQSRGVALGTISLVLLVARLGDVFVDPAVGALSDRFSTVIGRRRPWIVVGTVLTVLGVRHVFDPPAHVDAVYLLGWIGVLYFGWSLVTIPYLAWGGSLSSDYNRRSLISGMREFAAMAGIVLAAVAPALSPGSLEKPMRDLSGLVTWALPARGVIVDGGGAGAGIAAGGCAAFRARGGHCGATGRSDC